MSDGGQRIAVVTGGSRGIGRAVADSLAADNWSVLTVSRQKTTAEEGRPQEILADLSTAEGAHECLRTIKTLTNRVDLLVNNAGAIGEDESVLRVSEENMLASWRLHVMSPLLLARGLIAEFDRSSNPAVVNIGSVYGRVVDPDVLAYGTSKCALGYLTGALAMALAPRVRVNSVLPGHVDTDMTRAAPEEFIGQIRKETPLGRVATVGEVVAAVRFLASSESSFITGASIRVDGGFRLEP